MVRLFSIALVLVLLGRDELAGYRPVPPQAYAAPAEAADHVAEILVNEGEGRRGGRSRLMRHGNWLREDQLIEGRVFTAHSDFASATSFTYTRGGDGRYDSVWVSRPASGGLGRYRRFDTGRRETALGAGCRIWNTRGPGDSEEEGVNALSCDTRDGITLWTRTELARGGTVVSQTRALSFQRRPVPAAMARPPADLLRLAFWRPGDSAWAAAGPDFRVEFAADGRGAPPSRLRRILQRHGDWRSTDKWQYDGSRLLTMHNRRASLTYRQDIDGRPVMLQIYAPGEVEAIEEDWQPIADRAAETVLGESCRWMRWAALVADAAYHECRAADGVPLRIEEWSRGQNASFTATSVSRARLSPAAFAPPPAAVDWAAWGVAR